MRYSKSTPRLLLFICFLSLSWKENQIHMWYGREAVLLNSAFRWGIVLLSSAIFANILAELKSFSSPVSEEIVFSSTPLFNTSALTLIVPQIYSVQYVQRCLGTCMFWLQSYDGRAITQNRWCEDKAVPLCLGPSTGNGLIWNFLVFKNSFYSKMWNPAVLNWV